VIASQIKEAMARRGMTRKQLAEAVGRRPSDVTKWLSGSHNFTVDLLSEISEAVGARITGVEEGDSGGMVAGYIPSSAQLCFFREPGVAGSIDSGHSLVGPIVLPDECMRSLSRKASLRGEELGTYIRRLLMKEAAAPAVKASDFCGIWSDENFGMTTDELIADIRSHRSVHREIEEL